MCSKLSFYQLKSNCYIRRMLYVNLTVTTRNNLKQIHKRNSEGNLGQEGMLLNSLYCIRLALPDTKPGNVITKKKENYRPVSLINRRRQWHPTPVLLPGKSHGRRSLVGCSPWGREESDTTEWLHFHFSLLCIGEGKGNPLQCSCLENPRDAVAQSWTRLKWLSSSSILDKYRWKNPQQNIKKPNSIIH